jgi:hypothetical protein
MFAFDIVDFIAVGLVVLGLAAVMWEIALKSPRSFVEMVTDSRRFAEQAAGGPQLRVIPALATDAAAPPNLLTAARLAERSRAA